MSELILTKVQNYLTELEHGAITPKPEVLEAFGADAISTLTKNVVSPYRSGNFRLRLSNVGRPGCALQAEKLGLRRDPAPWSNKFRNAYGDLIERAALVVMYHAGVNIISTQQPVSLEVAGQLIDGTYDLVIAESEPRMYDIKSASNWAFNNIYKGANLKNILDKGDSFGYVVQLYGYSVAKGIPAGGLLVINKETGEWSLVPPPVHDEELRDRAIKIAAENVRRIVTNQPFRKDYTDINETYRKVETGNRVLHQTCVFCDFKAHCWPEAVYKPAQASKGRNPQMKWYTHIDKKYDKENQDD